MLGPLHKLLQRVLTRELANIIHTDEQSIVSVVNGNVRLENVRLRCSVLERLLSHHLGHGLPVKIVLAHITLLSVSIPWGDWSHGFTEVTVDGLTVLLASRTRLPDAEEVRAHRFFAAHIDWARLVRLELPPPLPVIDGTASAAPQA